MGMQPLNADEVEEGLLGVIKKIMRPVRQASVDLMEANHAITGLEERVSRETFDKEHYKHQYELLQTELSLVNVELSDRKAETIKLANERDEALKKLHSMLARVGALETSVSDVMNAATTMGENVQPALPRPANIDQIMDSMKNTVEGFITDLNKDNQNKLFQPQERASRASAPAFLTAPKGR